MKILIISLSILFMNAQASTIKPKTQSKGTNLRTNPILCDAAISLMKVKFKAFHTAIDDNGNSKDYLVFTLLND
jgi:hypothetical protein